MNDAAATPLVPRRGERNNNPGNIVWSPHIDWHGQLGIEIIPPGHADTPRFARFDTPEHGIRAIAKVLRSYVERDGVTTLRGAIERWAPATENATDAYVDDVAEETGLNPDAVIDWDLGDYAEVTRGIIKHEIGRVIYTIDLIGDAVAAAWS